MSRTPVLSQRLAVEVRIGGSTDVVLDARTLRSLRSTNTLTTGSAKLQATALYDPRDGSAWPYGLRAMDTVYVTGWAGRGKDTGFRYPLWTGYLDAVEITEDPQYGRQVQLTASTVYKAFEVTTETGQQFQARINWQAMAPIDVLTQACLACGLAGQFVAEDGPDLHTSPIAQVGSMNPLAIENPQYLAWAEIVASVATFAGRELFADEQGTIRYRLSRYDQPPSAAIPAERLVSTSATLDTDQGLVNEVYVYYGVPQGAGQQMVQAHAGPVPGDDEAHYRRRALILPAPWLSQPADAQWYADWVLSWATHNRRPGVASLAFWPQATLGAVYTLPWPPGRQMAYYVSSVVHDIQIGGPSTTVLGLTYGRQPEVRWFTEPVPANFGQYVTTPTPSGPTPPEGVNWRITYYTTQSLTTYSDSNGTYLLTSDGTKLYQQGWSPPGANGAIQPYGSVRPCAFWAGPQPGVSGPPAYAIPELGGATLSYGDRLFVESLGVTVECHDHIGTLAAGAGDGRQLDVFYWTTPQPISAWQDFSAVQYQRVAGAQIDTSPAPAPTDPPPGWLAAPASGGTPSASRFALGAQQLATSLGFDGDHRDNLASAGSDLAAFVRATGFPDVQCTLFVDYCAIHFGGFPGFVTQDRSILGWPNAKDWGNWLYALGWRPAWGQVPKPGDILIFGPGQTTPTGVVQDATQGDGHVAVVVAVTPPSGGGGLIAPGFVQVAQANCYYALESFFLMPTASGYFVGGPENGSIFGATAINLMRYPGAS